jgi:hypothetical protein
MNKFLIIVSMLVGTSVAFAAENKVQRKPSQEDGQQCLRFHGDAAKKTFLGIYPYTQGKVTAIVAEETKNGETVIATENIFCRVFKVGLPSDVKKAMNSLNTLPSTKFQCGYFISSEGNLSACSDPE